VEEIAKALPGIPVCRITVEAPETAAAMAAARSLMDIFGACGFPSRIVKGAPRGETSVHLQSGSENAATALAVQSAFIRGGFGATLLIMNEAPRGELWIALSERGLLGAQK
jgi:hypothetical protein